MIGRTQCREAVRRGGMRKVDAEGRDQDTELVPFQVHRKRVRYLENIQPKSTPEGPVSHAEGVGPLSGELQDIQKVQ